MTRIHLPLMLALTTALPALAAHHDDGKGGGGGQSGGGPFAASGVELRGHLSITELGGGAGVLLSDLWGWTDPLTNKKYAIVGRSDATAFVDVSNPNEPVYLGHLPSATGASVWREMKAYANHAFIVSDGNGAHGMQVFDLTRLRGVTSPQTFTADTRYTGVTNVHNIFINEATGFGYLVGSNTFSGGLHFVDVRNPLAPVAAGGFGGDGYTHDVQVVTYSGPDAAYVGREIAFASNEDTVTIVDVTNKAAPVMLSRRGYPGARYVHQGWLTEDQRYFLQNDELDEAQLNQKTRTHIWDLADLDNPLYLGFHEHQTDAIDHNLFIKGDYVYESNYTVGLRVLAIGDLANLELTEIAFFDTYPADDARSFNGQWGNYPFFDNNIVIASDRQNGLFVLEITAIPEPGSLLLGGLALALGGVAWRCRRSAARYFQAA
jgi:choice-of-anchor B domain-containing protein